jgi:hypothetical protein
MNIADKNGTWLQNEGQYAMVDPISGTRFEPGEPIKATHTQWVKDQPTIKRCGDPTSDLSEKDAIRLAAQNEADERARQEALAAAEAAQAAARGEQPAGEVQA